MRVCLCSCFSYPARRVRLLYAASYFHGWHVWLYHILPHCLINGTILGKNALNIKVLNDILYNFILKHFSL